MDVMNVGFYVWLATLVLAVYFYGRENGRLEEAKRRNSQAIQGEIVHHFGGNNCPPFYVRKEHLFPVLWCPFCGSECRHIGEVVKETNR